MSNTLVVSEVFGPTFQGEGLNVGQRVAFVRTGGCNLSCDWCDTPYTWDAERFNLRDELTRTPVDAIVEQVANMEVHRVVVSGGEPLLHQQQPGWLAMLEAFAWMSLPVEVETNGTIAPTDETALLVETFNVSPKLAHSGLPTNDRMVPAALRRFSELAGKDAAVLKVVVRQRTDVAAVRNMVDRLRWPLERAWVMPEGTTAQALLDRHKDVADAALDYCLNFTTRLHVLTWGEERAR